jgi:hypothetical protein
MIVRLRLRYYYLYEHEHHDSALYYLCNFYDMTYEPFVLLTQHEGDLGLHRPNAFNIAGMTKPNVHNHAQRN